MRESPARGQPARAPGSGSDPLAELARLIGQNDPFSEFGRDGARRVAAPPADWDVQPAAADYDHQTVAPASAAHPPTADGPPFAAPNYGRQAFGGPPLAAGGDLYQAENAVPGYPAPHAGGYGSDPRYPDQAQHAHEEEDLYDDVPPARRRIGIMAIAGIFALAVIGTAGAFGYRALFGSSGSSQPPPVITADTAPIKIVPATGSKDAQSNKQINDRVADRGQGERLVSREEQPVDIKDKPAAATFPQQGQDNTRTGSAPPPLGSGVIGEPKKVRTIAIRPDQGTVADAMPISAPPVAPSPAPVRQAAPVQAPPPRVVNNPPLAADPEPGPAPRQTRVAPVVRQAAPASSNAPLSLSPDSPAAQARAAAPVRTAAVPPPAQIAPAPAAATGGSAGAGGYAVQVSSQRSEAEAQAAFRSLQGKYPNQLGSRQALIHRVDLGEKGIYFRAMVGPFGSAGEAGELCSSLKSAGGQCIVQRN